MGSIQNKEPLIKEIKPELGYSEENKKVASIREPTPRPSTEFPPKKEIKLEDDYPQDLLSPSETMIMEDKIKKVTNFNEYIISQLFCGKIPSCQECKLNFHNLVALEEHKKIHTEKEFKSSSHVSVPQNPRLNTIDCEHCGVSISRKNMSRHIIRFHKTEKYKCDTCGKNLSSVEDLVNHETDEENCMNYMNSLINNEIKTESCQTTNDSSINDEVETEASQKSMNWLINDEVETSPESMNWLINDEVNLEIGGKAKVKVCDICHLSISAANFSRHLKSHERITEEISSTPIREKKAISTPSLNRYCDVCEIDVKGQYIKHIGGAFHKEMVHQKETGFVNRGSDKFACSKCLATFEKKKNFGMHLLKVHSKM